MNFFTPRLRTLTLLISFSVINQFSRHIIQFFEHFVYWNIIFSWYFLSSVIRRGSFQFISFQILRVLFVIFTSSPFFGFLCAVSFSVTLELRKSWHYNIRSFQKWQMIGLIKLRLELTFDYASRCNGTVRFFGIIFTFQSYNETLRSSFRMKFHSRSNTKWKECGECGC